MTSDGQHILDHLHAVAAERQRRRADAALGERVRAVKDYQHRRFAKTYADLLAQPRYTDAARFFLDDLYGPTDFSQRDDQFARVVPALVRLFPEQIVGTVRSLAELHAISERLDTRVAQALPGGAITPDDYVRGWQAAGHAVDRERQIALVLAVGQALDRYTRNPVLRHSLKLMRAPARSAGLTALQGFLERGFDTFRAMRGAEAFLSTVAARERELAAALFTADAGRPDVARATPGLGQLP